MTAPADSLIKISEIFGPTIQGEGALIGKPTVFVRTGGCDYRCTWCDTLHAVDSQYRHTWTPMTVQAIWEQVQHLSGDKPLLVSLSGGNPAIQPLGPLIALGKTKGYHFALETQGSVAQDWFCNLDTLILSPKPPSSGMTTDWDALETCIAKATMPPLPAGERARVRGEGVTGGCEIVLKIVIFDEVDYAYARNVATRFPNIPMTLQAGNRTPPPAEINSTQILHDMHWLINRALQDRWFSVRILPQLHVLLWGNQKGV